MLPTRQGSIRLFRLWGIDVHLHWLWFVAGIYLVSQRVPQYEAPFWALFEYLGLFSIVLLHEFGHALACRSVGGDAHQIILWPLGGVAYVNPPARPGATLWSIAAGPLVNVALIPILLGAAVALDGTGWAEGRPDLARFIRALQDTNLVILIFNLLPIYPLDGGQILRSLLWFFMGKARSLMVASVLGLIGGAALAVWAVRAQSIWMGMMILFLLSNCWAGFKYAQVIRKIERLPRRDGFACPVCRTVPPLGAFWRCQQCQQPFDMFETSAVCPHCATINAATLCPHCGESRPIQAWDARVHDI
ncbi:MAG: Peptidase [Verrucomicrobia bacterium]|nr:Peptidase [Verrucomicrobiota bacterium]